MPFHTGRRRASKEVIEDGTSSVMNEHQGVLCEPFLDQSGVRQTSHLCSAVTAFWLMLQKKKTARDREMV